MAFRGWSFPIILFIGVLYCQTSIAKEPSLFQNPSGSSVAISSEVDFGYDLKKSAPFKNADPPYQRSEYARIPTQQSKRIRQFNPRRDRGETYLDALDNSLHHFRDEIVQLFWGYLKLISVVAFLVSCASNPAFSKYLNSFEKESERAGVTYRTPRFEWGKPGNTALSSHNLAECITGTSLTPARVVVDEKQWSKLSEASKEALVFHEMGHCALGKLHGPGIMQPSLISARTFLAHRKSLVSALFHH